MSYLKKLLFILLLTSFFLMSCQTEEPEINHTFKDFLLNTSAIDPALTNNKDFNSILLSDCEIYDSINDYTWKYSVLIPKDFSEQKNYSVLYLLHGKSCDNNVWCSQLELQRIIDSFYDNKILDTIIIMPEAQNSYYVDGFINNLKYETFFINRLIPEIEKTFSIRNDSMFRFIGGFSMGGYGAMYYAMKYNGLFSLCYSMSAPLDGNNNPLTPSVFDFIDKNIEETPSLILDIGKNDPFINTNLKASLALRILSIPHECIIRPGEHNAQFWKESLYILFDRLSYFVNK